MHAAGLLAQTERLSVDPAVLQTSYFFSQEWFEAV